MSAAPVNSYFPNIPRFITERVYSHKNVRILLFVVAGFFSAVLLIGIVWQGLILLQNIDTSKKLTKDRQDVLWETAYWKGVVDTNIGYRDIYHRIAILEYKLGNKQEAKTYIQKALEQDPNFEEARVLGQKIEASFN
jgi:hypothetical protein